MAMCTTKSWLSSTTDNERSWTVLFTWHAKGLPAEAAGAWQDIFPAPTRAPSGSQSRGRRSSGSLRAFSSRRALWSRRGTTVWRCVWLTGQLAVESEAFYHHRKSFRRDLLFQKTRCGTASPVGCGIQEPKTDCDKPLSLLRPSPVRVDVFIWCLIQNLSSLFFQ